MRTEDRAKAVAAMGALGKLGYVAATNFSCCMSCASAALAEDPRVKAMPEEGRRVVYWHKQDHESAFGRPRRGDYSLRHSHGSKDDAPLMVRGEGDAAVIAEAFASRGLVVDASGWPGECIEVRSPAHVLDPVPPPVPPPARTVLERVEAGDYNPKAPYTPATRDAYREEERRLNGDFKRDLLHEHGVEGNPRADRAYDLAWEQGHSGGHSEVAGHFADLVGLIK